MNRMGKLTIMIVMMMTCVMGDIFLHNPRGSNDRNCEKNENRANANLLFNSQNNAKGGYACPYPANEKLYFHSGSVLPIEWTAQHGCGNGRTHCDLVIQYMCADNIRDGTPKGPNNGDGTKTIPEEVKSVQETAYAMHEDYEYYKQCKDRQRNLGLFTADRNVKNDRGATATRQNENGDRYGFECPEERDYYPYWHPSPWVDIAVITNGLNRCNFYRNESQNVKPKHYCRAKGTSSFTAQKFDFTAQQLNSRAVAKNPTAAPTKKATAAPTKKSTEATAKKPTAAPAKKPTPAPGPKKGNYPNNKQACEAAGMEWVAYPAWGVPPPECKRAPWDRENHLGNTGGGIENNRYWWKVPEVTREKKCILRVRYNISSGDADFYQPGQYLDSESNGAKSPLKGTPIVTYFDDVHLAVKVNTNQYGRTFQDRSYVFRIVPAHAGAKAAGSQVHNLNVRGKRGNIVQTFPAVEYDFVPNRLTVQQNDFIHFQWVGSDYNPERDPNNGEGGPTARSDRHNLVEKENAAHNYPFKNPDTLFQKTMFVTSDGKADKSTMKKLAYLDQSNCQSLESQLKNKNNNAKEREATYCSKINTPSPYFDGGVVQMRKLGTFHYMSSRNNNFSNRDQKGTIRVLAKKTPDQRTT
eukprot:TRINITY_DN3133_c0_g1_i2.p1 TRINITY_DN3133_c0_g1~~TRINITY_DN3133_c0_g1_i2.p1  ORF type:complete len:638 (-),score=187.56 TRINITY_DN3133_c0_g1_i2:39-1952(-)